MKVAIVSDHFGNVSGGTRVCASTIQALNSANITPTVLSYFSNPKHRENIKQLGYEIKYKHEGILPFKMEKFSLYKGYAARLFGKLPNERDFDFVYDFSGIFPEYNMKGMYYLYYDYWQMKRKGIRSLYSLIFPKSKIERMFKEKKMKFTVLSIFSQGVFWENYGVEVPILYPPVDLKAYENIGSQETKNVITIGGFSPFKNQLMQIEIAEEVKKLGFHFYIIGGTDFDEYYKKCEEKAKSAGNVTLIPNAKKKEIIETFKKCSYFLHSFPGEHFGIATVEAISANLIPIIPNFGGNAEIVENKELLYDNKEEAVVLFRKINSWDGNKRKEILVKLKDRIKIFDEGNFRESILKFIK